MPDPSLWHRADTLRARIIREHNLTPTQARHLPKLGQMVEVLIPALSEILRAFYTSLTDDDCEAGEFDLDDLFDPPLLSHKITLSPGQKKEWDAMTDFRNFLHAVIGGANSEGRVGKKTKSPHAYQEAALETYQRYCECIISLSLHTPTFGHEALKDAPVAPLLKTFFPLTNVPVLKPLRRAPKRPSRPRRPGRDRRNEA
jgi:hypothetical protein